MCIRDSQTTRRTRSGRGRRPRAARSAAARSRGFFLTLARSFGMPGALPGGRARGRRAAYEDPEIELSVHLPRRSFLARSSDVGPSGHLPHRSFLARSSDVGPSGHLPHRSFLARSSDVQEPHVPGVALDESPSALDVFAHQDGEDLVGLSLIHI